MITVKELYFALEQIEKIYKFDDEKAFIEVKGCMPACEKDAVRIITQDEQTGVDIILTKPIDDDVSKMIGEKVLVKKGGD